MNARIAGAVEFVRNQALFGALATGLLGAGLIAPSLGSADPGPKSRDFAPLAGMRLPAAVTGGLMMTLASPPPVQPGNPEPRQAHADMDVAIAELPMAELPTHDAAAPEAGAQPPDAAATTVGSWRPLHGRLSHAVGPLRRQVTTMKVSDTNALAQAFQAHDYTLDQARRGEPVPPLQIERVPGDLVNVRDGNERKALFIKALLPIVLETNERILAERDHLVRMHNRHAAGRGHSVIERMWLAEVADRYGTEPANFVELLRRVDMVPPSMAIAQAGVESGWGTSYAARIGNSLFGQIQNSGRHSVKVPWRPGPAMPQPFSSVAESVEAYILNLNTHFAYADFRTERARLRASNSELDGYHLVGLLRRYSELGQGYINFVRGVIRENRLSDFDRAKLPPI